MLDRSRSRDRSKAGGAFSPAGLFVSGAQGAWYDPSDFSTLFQNSTGTTPVTAVEQPVRLMLDRSRGLVLGPELVTNGGFATDSDWTKGASWTISGGTANYNNAGAAQALSQTVTLTAGRAYVITYTVSALSSGFVYARLVGSATTNGVTLTANGASTEIIIAPASPTTLGFVAQGVLSIDNISIRELPGNHALAPNDASRPVLRALYNLLERSEEFDNAYWAKVNTTVTANAGVAPDGTTTADLFYPTTTGINRFVWRSSGVSGISGASYTVSVYAKASGKSILYFATLGGGTLATNLPFFDLSTGQVAQVGTYFDTVTIQAVGNNWYRCTATKNAVAAVNQFPLYGVADASGNITATTSGTDGILIWGAQLLTAADQASTGGAYQRIAAATDYDVSNPVWRPYLAFDGSDDSFSTSSIDFSGTDEMTVFAGVTKLSDAAIGLVAELSASSLSNPGFFLVAPIASGASGNFAFFSSGSIAPSTPATSSTILAPATRVLTGQSDISTDSQTLRINGAADGSSAQDQGTGNYSNAALFIGRRNNTSFPFNGRLTSLIVLGRTATAAEISATEQWIAGKTGVTI